MESLKIIKAFERFRILSKEEKRLFFEAVFFLFYSKVLLLMPFRFCIKKLAQNNDRNEIMSPDTLTEIRNAVRRANRLAWWQNICLVKSFAARFMLQRRGISSVMYYGLKIKNKKLEAHAYVLADGIYITPKGSDDFKVIHTI
jgi:hypothetical protein